MASMEHDCGECEFHWLDDSYRYNCPKCHSGRISNFALDSEEDSPAQLEEQEDDDTAE